MILVIWFIIQSWISGYRDMARFWYDGTWASDQNGDPISKANWLPYWKAFQSSKKDPFHVAGGTMWALIIILLFFEAIWFYWMSDLLILKPLFVIGTKTWYWSLLTLMLHGVIFWVGFYWQRNLMMHIWGMRKGFKQWKYLNPAWKFFGWVRKKLRKK